MTIEDERLEGFLRQFQPRRPRPLPVSDGSQRLRWVTGVAAGVMIAAVLWSAAERDEPRSPVVGQISPASVVPAPSYPGRLTVVAEWDLEAVDRMLTDISRRTLPDVARPESSLHQLSPMTWSER